MFLRAGALSLALLVVSRLLGLLRESALAAAFGASGMGDVAVLMLTLPDWMASVFASGALAYVMLPAWSGQSPAAIAASQARLARVLVAAGIVLAALLMLAREPVLAFLAPGLGGLLREDGVRAMLWSAAALPLALLAALWATRLQHEREFVGMYGANVIVNGALIASLWLIAASAMQTGHAVAALGAGLLAAMGLRLAWLLLRMPKAERGEAPSLPPPSAWVWAALAAGLPLALPFAARSAASQGGEGALATFNYAWKLVELPLMLAIQLVATLAFPTIARAFAAETRESQPAIRSAVRPAFALAWTLACAAAAGLIVAAPAVAKVLFGWGRMDVLALASVAEWGRIGAWSLLPQAVIAVSLTVLAAQRRMHGAVIAYAVALAALLGSAALGVHGGAALMLALDILLTGVAVTLVATSPAIRHALPWRAMLVSAAVLAALAIVAWGGERVPASVFVQIACAAIAACMVLLVTTWLSPDLRAALRR